MTRTVVVPAALEPLISAFAGDPDVSVGPSMATSVLKVRGKIFAMINDGRLVVKLPKPDVDALEAAGEGRRFQPSPGRVMKEWIALETSDAAERLGFAQQARRFVGGLK